MSESPSSISASDRGISPWTMRQKLCRLAWSIVESTLFRCSPQPCYRWRGWLLRLFGAKIAWSARIRATVRIAVPWHLTVGDQTAIGDHAIIYALGTIRLGDRVTISQYAHLCAGSHDYRRPDMPLLKLPIDIEDDVWIATDVFVGPNVRIGRGSIVGARSSVFSDLPGGWICLGSPARAVRRREEASSCQGVDDPEDR